MARLRILFGLILLLCSLLTVVDPQWHTDRYVGGLHFAEKPGYVRETVLVRLLQRRFGYRPGEIKKYRPVWQYRKKYYLPDYPPWFMQQNFPFPKWLRGMHMHGYYTDQNIGMIHGFLAKNRPEAYYGAYMEPWYPSPDINHFVTGKRRRNITLERKGGGIIPPSSEEFDLGYRNWTYQEPIQTGQKYLVRVQIW